MPHIHTQYYGNPLTILRDGKIIKSKTMLVEIKNRTDIESANQLLQTSVRRLTTENDLMIFYGMYGWRLSELFVW